MSSAKTDPPASPAYADVLRAQARLLGIAHRTPVLTSASFDALTSARLFLKCENLQRVGAFKFRGAYNAIAALTNAQRARGVVAYSSGNHAQAVALAGRLLGVSATIVMPSDAPAIKVAATRGYGAEIRFYDRYRESREQIGASLAQERGVALIPPFDHPDVIAGQGTAVKEMLEDVGELDLLLVPVGGGGLISGSALSARALAPACRIVGVEPEAGNDAQQSLRRGERVEIAVPKSIADGALTTRIGSHTFPIMRSLVDDITTVPDAALVQAMVLLAERMKLLVEPTGCLGLAAALTGAASCAGKRVGIVLSGGNVDLSEFARLVSAPA